MTGTGGSQGAARPCWGGGLGYWCCSFSGYGNPRPPPSPTYTLSCTPSVYAESVWPVAAGVLLWTWGRGEGGPLAHSDFFCSLSFLLAYPTPSWHILLPPGISYYFLAYPTTSWRILLPPGIFYYLLAYPTSFWHILLPPGIS